jgi:hypothetical protein
VICGKDTSRISLELSLMAGISEYRASMILKK